MEVQSYWSGPSRSGQKIIKFQNKVKHQEFSVRMCDKYGFYHLHAFSALVSQRCLPANLDISFLNFSSDLSMISEGKLHLT